MTVLSKTARLVAAPRPAFVGTRVTIEVADGGQAFCISAATKAATSAAVSVDWGDGSSETVACDIAALTHAYANAGAYEVRISDDVSSLRLLRGTAGDASAPMVRHVASNARALERIGDSGFAYAANLQGFDLSAAAVSAFGNNVFRACTKLTSAEGLPAGLTALGNSTFLGCSALATVPLPKGVTVLANAVFRGCSALSGEVALPFVRQLDYPNASSASFAQCAGISRIVFSADNEATIRASRGYVQSPMLGAPNAVVVFRRFPCGGTDGSVRT